MQWGQAAVRRCSRNCHDNCPFSPRQTCLGLLGVFRRGEHFEQVECGQDGLRGGFESSATDFLLIARRVCEALAHVHARGFVHYDLKPANVMLCPDDTIRLVDFGLAHEAVTTRLSLNGKLVVARDIAHAKIKERLDAGEPMPQYLRDHCVYYAGPAKTPEGYASGSFGPTTAGRMDSYVDQLQAAGGSFVMLAKGNRSKAVTDACAQHGGFYLGSIGGPAARLAQDCITKVEVLEYPELGMEAVWRIEVQDFPAFIVVDDKGNDFFALVNEPSQPVALRGQRGG